MSGFNRITREDAKRSLFPSAIALVGSTTSYNAGDLIVLDTSTHKLRAVTAGDLGGNFVGISEVTIVNGKLASPYVTDVDASAAITDSPGAVIGVVCKLVLKTGDSINPGVPVYLDPTSGTFHVTVTAPMSGILVGLYQGAALTSVVAGTLIEVKLIANTGSTAFFI